jgi:hypothetical protein
MFILNRETALLGPYVWNANPERLKPKGYIKWSAEIF